MLKGRSHLGAFRKLCVTLDLATVVCLAPVAGAATYRVVYTFSGMPDGASPQAGLVADGIGRLYGTTIFGGDFAFGTVFRLTPPPVSPGAWTEEILHSFGGLDGGNPVSQVNLGPSGEIYGTTIGQGAFSKGTAFRLDNVSGWPLTVLHAFGPKPDGKYTHAGMVFGLDGLLYGSMGGGSLRYDGDAFSVSPAGDTTEYAVIYRFGVGPSAGKSPSQLVSSPDGRLFGVASTGGAFKLGTAFYLNRIANGAWHQTTLHDFGAPGDVTNPQSALLPGRGALNKSFFGCGEGGSHQQGAVFLLTPPLQGPGPWTETILYNFGDQPGDPNPHPNNACNLTQDDSGNLFGLTPNGGAGQAGAFFELSPPSGTTGWTETVLYSFSVAGGRGYAPYGAPLRIGGKFYGTASSNLPSGAGGVVWELTP